MQWMNEKYEKIIVKTKLELDEYKKELNSVN
jgi:hypothetical protein